MRFSSSGRVVSLVAWLLWAPVAAAQTPSTDKAPAPGPDEASSSPLPPLPPLPPPAPDDDAGTTAVGSTAAATPKTGDTAPPGDPAQTAAAHRSADTSEDEDATDAEATKPPDPWATRPIVAELQFGLGTPIGLAGLAIDYSPVPILGLDLGVGLGPGGVEYAFTSRLRVIRAGRRTHVAVYLGGGLSGGAYNSEYAFPDIAVDGSQTDSESPVPHYHWDAAFWTNLEAGVEIRFKSNVSLRPFAGVEYLLNPGNGVAVFGQRGDAPSPPERWLPYLGLAIGYAVRPW
jgi:hypothetical protein